VTAKRVLVLAGGNRLGDRHSAGPRRRVAGGRQKEAHSEHGEKPPRAPDLGDEDAGEDDSDNRGPKVGQEIMGFRPTVSNSRPSTSGPAKLLSAHTMKNTGTTPDATE
jgi:hypothetical protein